MREWSQDEVWTVIDASVREFLMRAECAHPPVEACQIVERHLKMEVEEPHARAGRGHKRGNSGEATDEQRQWAAAQMIVAHLKPSVLERLDVSAAELRGQTGESLANLIAYRLLVPQMWFATDAPALEFDLPHLKDRYRTASHEVVAWRMLDLPQPCVITIVDDNHVTRRRSNSWRINRGLMPPEKECQEYVNSHSRSRVVQAEGWTVQGWPVHHLAVKREVLRSVFDEV